MATIQQIFTLSRWLHKYVGLTLLLVFLFMGGTGILINHPSLLSSWSVPASWLGESYQYTNWNRFSFRDSILVDDGGLFIAGKLGVWYSPGTGLVFEEINAGLPKSFYLRDTNTLLAMEFQGHRRVFAGGRSGLFYRDQDAEVWSAVKSVPAGVEIVDLLLTKGQIMAFSAHDCYRASVLQEKPSFEQVTVPVEREGQWIPGYRLLFELHSGKLFGLAGRLLVDVAALLMIFLCLSAVYIWFVPWRKRRLKGCSGKSRWLATFYSYHLHLGIWVALPLFIVAGSGAFIRPPLILFSSIITIPLSALSQKTPEILRAVISGDGSLVLATRDGWYKGSSTFTSPLQPVTPPVPVFGMGTTVLESLNENQLLVGSFSGLFKWNVTEGTGVDLDGKTAPAKAGLMPGDVMVAAAIMDNGTLAGYADYKRGLRKPDNTPILDRPFPVALLDNKTSLYHFLFELHNGRFLRDTIGAWYILYIPLAGIALMLVIFTGTFDWLKRKKILFITDTRDS